MIYIYSLGCFFSLCFLAYVAHDVIKLKLSMRDMIFQCSILIMAYASLIGCIQLHNIARLKIDMLNAINAKCNK